MYDNAHDLSYMLDPRFIGEGLPRGNRLQLEDVLFKFLVDDEPRDSFNETRVQTIGIQWTEFVIAAEQEKAEDSTRFKMLANGAKTVLQHWLVDGKDWPDLRQIAIKLFSMATLTATS
ncbi:unnamed protein product, partial [Sphagnum balticum]